MDYVFSRLSKHPFFKESVYNWEHVDDTEIQEVKPLYRSQYNTNIKRFYQEKKSATPKTMGYFQTPLRSPQEYLKKRSGEKKLIAEAKSIPCLCRENRKTGQNADVTEKTPVVQKHFKRDFISENALEAIRAPARTPTPRMIDDRKGHSFELEESGWAPKYINKEDYGEKPKYMEDIEKQLQESRAKFQDFLYAEQQMTTPVRMSQQTKQEIYMGIVRNWKELLRRYLMLPLKTETPLQLRRKLEIEKKIDSLERDIELLVKHKDIFISKRNTTFEDGI